MASLNPRQKSRLARLVAGEAIRQVLTKYNFGNLAIILMPDDPDQFTIDGDRVAVFDDHSRITGEVFDLPEKQAVAVVIPDPYLFVRPARGADYHPEDMGFDDPYNPRIDELWPVEDIRQALTEIAAIDAPPIRKKLIVRPVEVKGGINEIN